MVRITIVVFALYAICCAMALGQVVQPAQFVPGDAPGTAPSATPAVRPADPSPVVPTAERPAVRNDGVRAEGLRPDVIRDTLRPETPPPTVGEMMFRNGGSLLRATLSTPPDPDRAKLGNIAWYAVPEPLPKTIHKHDLVTIVINEASQASSTGTTDLKKDAALDAKIDSYIRLNLAKLSATAATPTTAPELKMEGSRSFKGDATVDRADTLVARITAEVLDVKPNGTLVLQARKKIKTDEEEQQFVLTGACRAEDVTPDNTVLSTQIYDMEFQKNSKGAVRATTKRGWVPKLLDFVNIF